MVLGSTETRSRRCLGPAGSTIKRISSRLSATGLYGSQPTKLMLSAASIVRRSAPQPTRSLALNCSSRTWSCDAPERSAVIRLHLHLARATARTSGQTRNYAGLHILPFGMICEWEDPPLAAGRHGRLDHGPSLGRAPRPVNFGLEWRSASLRSNTPFKARPIHALAMENSTLTIHTDNRLPRVTGRNAAPNAHSSIRVGSRRRRQSSKMMQPPKQIAGVTTAAKVQGKGVADQSSRRPLVA